MGCRSGSHCPSLHSPFWRCFARKAARTQPCAGSRAFLGPFLHVVCRNSKKASSNVCRHRLNHRGHRLVLFDERADPTSKTTIAATWCSCQLPEGTRCLESRHGTCGTALRWIRPKGLRNPSNIAKRRCLIQSEMGAYTSEFGRLWFGTNTSRTCCDSSAAILPWRALLSAFRVPGAQECTRRSRTILIMNLFDGLIFEPFRAPSKQVTRSRVALANEIDPKAIRCFRS